MICCQAATRRPTVASMSPHSSTNASSLRAAVMCCMALAAWVASVVDSCSKAGVLEGFSLWRTYVCTLVPFDCFRHQRNGCKTRQQEGSARH